MATKEKEKQTQANEQPENAPVKDFVKVIAASKEKLTVKERYDLTLSQAAQKLSDQKGQAIDFDLWCEYITPDSKTGEVKEILSLRTPEGEVYATNSATFIREFMKIVDMIEDAKADGEKVDFKSVIVKAGTSKSGREFITAVYNE